MIIYTMTVIFLKFPILIYSILNVKNVKIGLMVGEKPHY